MLIGEGWSNLDDYMVREFSFLVNEYSEGKLANGLFALIISLGGFSVPYLFFIAKSFDDKSLFTLWIAVLFVVGDFMNYIIWLPFLFDGKESAVCSVPNR